ncbi:unnamed protein product [Gadus morhua 'NCC']
MAPRRQSVTCFEALVWTPMELQFLEHERQRIRFEPRRERYGIHRERVKLRRQQEQFRFGQDYCSVKRAYRRRSVTAKRQSVVKRMWVVSSGSPGRSSHLWTVAFLILLQSYQIVQGHVEKSSSALIVVDEGGDEEATVGDEFSDEEDLEVFQPTDHWQTIKPGQAVPRGSHVRLHLQTGHRDVRLGAEQMRGEEQRRDRPHEASQSYWSAEELKLKLKKMKDSSPRSGAAYQQDQNKFRSIEDLRKDLATLNLLVETDFQVIKRLLDQLNRTSSTEQRLQILLELEYLVHQVDNAQTLCSMGGLQLLLGGLNSSDFRLQDRSAFVLGSALARLKLSSVLLWPPAAGCRLPWGGGGFIRGDGVLRV